MESKVWDASWQDSIRLNLLHIQPILTSVINHFLGKEIYFRAFADADSRLEGWVKAELIVLFNKLMADKVIESYDREAKILSASGRKQIDFRLSLGQTSYLCEVKTPVISQAAKTPRNLHFYFREDDRGLIKDFRKLDELPDYNKLAICFIYPNPGLDKWQREIKKLPLDLAHWTCITNPEDFPDYLFVSLWCSEG
jgi:hypothetical protein